MAGLDLDTILGGALGYLQSALGIDSPVAGGAPSAWHDYAASTFPQLAGGGGRSSFPALAGGGGGASGFPQLAGGGGPSNFPVLAGSAGGVSSFPSLAGAGNYLSQLAGQATSAAQGAYGFAHPPGRDTRGTPQPGPAPSAAPGLGGGSGGADDNAGLTGAQIDTWLTSTRPNAPIAGLGQYILDTANKYGVSAPLMLGIALKESELGTTAGPGKILTGITDPALDQGLGQNRAFQGFSTWQGAIDATARTLNSALYKGKPLEQQVGTWYVGPQAFAAGGLDATDQAGNGSVRDYVNMVRQVYGQLGVRTAVAQRQLAGEPGTVPVGTTPWAGASGVLAVGQQWLGKPYVWGGADPQTSFDCSGLVQYAFAQTGARVPRTAQQQYDATQRLSGDQLQAGDLVFFTNTYASNEPVTHVGIFAGYDAQGHPVMLNAADNGVQYARFDDPYWSAHYYGAGRVAQ